MMLSVQDLLELAKQIGIPSTAVVVAVGLFHYGIVPSLTTKTHTIAERTEALLSKESANIDILVKQHNLQMIGLTKALREICLNTAKTDERLRKCSELDDRIDVHRYN